jgi:hypothetical protein
MSYVPPPTPSHTHLRMRSIAHGIANIFFSNLRQKIICLIAGAFLGIFLWIPISNSFFGKLYKIQGTSNCRELWNNYISYLMDYRVAHGKPPDILPTIFQLAAAGYGSEIGIKQMSSSPGFYFFDYTPNTSDHSSDANKDLTIFFIYKDYVVIYKENGANISSFKQLQETFNQNQKENPLR